jgi:hypothetical protein
VTTIITREIGASPKGSPLTNSEVDQNFINLNTDKAEKASPTFTGTVTLPTSLLNVTTSSYPTVRPTLNLDFANSKVLDPRITFVRNSTATYYDGQTTALAEQNLLTYSQTFASPWAYIRSTVPASTIAAPDGTISGVLFTESSSAGTQSIAPFGGGLATSVAGTYTYSVYGKNNGRYLTLAGNNGISNYISVIFDLSTGTYYQYQSGGQVINSVSCTQVGSTGWYRCVVTATFTASSGVNIASSNVTTVPTGGYGLPTYTGNGASGFYLWGAQLEQRSSVTAYTPTTTAAITNYIPQLMTAPAGVARFDCDPITRNSLGLLIEESRTNLATYSENFDNAVWQKSRSKINSNVIVAPDGTLTADKLVEDTQTGAHHANKGSYSFIVSTTYCLSVYVKAAERSNGTLGLGNVTALFGTGGNALAHYDLIAGTCVISSSNASSAGIQNISNGWFRVWLVATCTTAGSDTYFATFLRNGTATTTAYTGDGTSGLYLWGAQLEVGAFPTSYIPTVASTVTRAADQASMTGTNFSSWYNQSQGSMYAETTNASNGIIYGRIASINSANSSIELLTYPNSNLGGALNLNNSFIFNSSVTASVLTVLTKSLISYSATSVSLIANGNTVLSAALTAIPTNLNTLSIGSSFNNQYVLCGHIRKLSYYPVALSSTNLVALTS